MALFSTTVTKATGYKYELLSGSQTILFNGGKILSLETYDTTKSKLTYLIDASRDNENKTFVYSSDSVATITGYAEESFSNELIEINYYPNGNINLDTVAIYVNVKDVSLGIEYDSYTLLYIQSYKGETRMVVSDTVAELIALSISDPFDNIITDGNTLAWWDDTEEYMTKDGAELVSSWADRSGNDNHLLQAGADALKPTWTSDGVLFDGSDDFLKAANFTIGKTVTIYLLLKQITWTRYDTIFDNNLTNKGKLYQDPTTSKLHFNGLEGSNVSGDASLDTWRIVRIQVAEANSTAAFIQIDDGTPSVVAATVDMGGFMLGNRVAEDRASHIQVKDVIIRTIADTETDRDIIYDELKKKLVTLDELETIAGSNNATYVEDTFTYSSSIDSIANLAGKYSYCTGFTGYLPIMFLQHGWLSEVDSITTNQMRQYSELGYFVVVVGMRGNDGADGSEDASGKELYDVYDALTYIKSNFAITSSKKAVVIGFSGGGGNAYGLASKFPDAFSNVVSYFGMSDYGYAETGWYYDNDTYKSSISSRIGGTPVAVPNNYFSRDARQMLPFNYFGKLRFYHDPTDANVDVRQSDLLETALIANGMSNYYYEQAAVGHATFSDYDLADISTEVLASQSFTIARKGEIKVGGYIKTKLFEIWLGDGLSEFADLNYDVDNNSYTITPQTGSMDVVITQADGKTGSQTISEETEIIVS